MVDLDLGGSNLHTIFGISRIERNISDFIFRKVRSLNDVVFKPSGYSFDFIAGLLTSVPNTSFPAATRNKLIRHLKKLRYSYILLDLGAGITPHVLDFFNIDQGVVILTPEPTSVENVYRFIRAAFHRKLMKLNTAPRWKKLVKDALEKPGSFYREDILKFLEDVKKNFPSYQILVEEVIENFKTWLIINMANKNSSMGEDIPLIAERLLGLKVGFLGTVDFDTRVSEDVRRRLLTTAIDTDSDFSKDISLIAEKIARVIR